MFEFFVLGYFRPLSDFVSIFITINFYSISFHKFYVLQHLWNYNSNAENLTEKKNEMKADKDTHTKLFYFMFSLLNYHTFQNRSILKCQALKIYSMYVIHVIHTYCYIKTISHAEQKTMSSITKLYHVHVVILCKNEWICVLAKVGNLQIIFQS